MLLAIAELFAELEALLTEKKEVKRLHNTERPRNPLPRVNYTCTPFDTATQMLSSQLKPILHLVEPGYQT